ncbi:MAG: hypothetical protein WCJ30_01470 [Deltaproteobacteria bacterium]
MPTAIHIRRVAIAFLGALGWTRVIDPDTPWNLRVGELIVATGSLPTSDPFSYTSHQPWLLHEWLSEVVLAIAFRAGGWVALAALQSAVLAATVTAVLWGTRDDAEAAPATPTRALIEIAPVVPLVLVLREAFSPRATLFAIPLFAAMLALCTRLARTQRAAWWLLPLCGVVLTQVHGGNPEGVALVGLLALSTGRPAWFGLAALMALATCVGPHGWHVHAHVFSLRGSMGSIREWQPLYKLLERGSHVYLLVPLAMVAAVIALGVRRSRREALAGGWLFAALCLALWTALAWRYQRFAIQASIVATVCVLPVWRAWIRQERFIAPRVATLAIVLVSLGALTTSDRRAGHGLQPARFPEGAVAYLRAHTPRGPMFNSYNFGGYLLWAWSAERVFIDGRAVTVYAPEHIATLEAVYADPSRFVALERKWGFHLAVVQKPGRAAGLYRWLLASPDWRLVYEDALAAVFTR